MMSGAFRAGPSANLARFFQGQRIVALADDHGSWPADLEFDQAYVEREIARLSTALCIRENDRAPLEGRYIAWLRALPYGLYLKTNEWRWTRFFALERADWRCQFCNKPRRLQVHHRRYELGRERLADVAVLCDACHAFFHESRQLQMAGPQQPREQ